MWRRSALSLPLRALSTGTAPSAAAPQSQSQSQRSTARKVIQIGLISLAGGFTLSALNDLATFHGCTSKAIEKASENSQIVEAIGLPIVRGPWYDASLAVGHRRSSVSCTFPVSGPHGSAIFQFKAIRAGEDGLFSFLKHREWDILLMEALIHKPGDDEKPQAFRISLTNSVPPSSTPSSTD